MSKKYKKKKKITEAQLLKELEKLNRRLSKLYAQGFKYPKWHYHRELLYSANTKIGVVIRSLMSRVGARKGRRKKLKNRG